MKKDMIVKVTIPYLHSDNPQATFKTRDGSWESKVSITAPLTKFMAGKHEAYFRLRMDGTQITSMTAVESKLYYADEPIPEA